MPPEITQLGAASAAVITVWLFLRHNSQEREKDRESRDKERSADRAVWENHLSSSVRTQAETAAALRELRDELRFTR